MNAILVSVDFSDILSLTLPYNRHHFERVMVVTTPEDKTTQALALAHDAEVYTTGAFYQDGALFNKFRALEEGLDVLGRKGWLTIMDADICWPQKVDLNNLILGTLTTPFRRMCETLPNRYQVPDESTWGNYPLHRQQIEFAGFTQIFHANDHVLGDPPWHQTNWRHCGGGDSFFQAKWSESHKVRPTWQVLHIGPAGVNWAGRASNYLDGSTPTDAREKVQRLRTLVGQRRGHGPNRFSHEKLTP